MPKHLYSAYGLRIASAIDLPLVPAHSNGAWHEPDVVIRHGEVPVTLDGATLGDSASQVSPGEFLFAIAGVGRIWARNGREVVVYREEGAPESILALMVSQAVMGALLHQRGQLPLHASGISVEGSCVAFLGNSGDGKSTLAAALRDRGYQILCDDICAIDWRDGVPTVWPGMRQPKLWADAASALGLNTESVPLVHPKEAKYRFPNESDPPDMPHPLKGCYVLEQAPANPEGFRRLKGAEAVQALLDLTYRRQCALARGGPEYFQAYTRLADTVQIYAWSRPWGFENFQASLDSLEKHLKSL
jgi:hypothetical protein